MKTASQLDRKVSLAFGAAILTLLVVGAVSYRGMIVSSESDRWVRHTHEVIENLQNLSSAMDGVEAGVRGYVLTGKDSYIEACHANMSMARQYETVVGNLTEDNRLQQGRLPNLQRLTLGNFQFAEMVINLH